MSWARNGLALAPPSSRGYSASAPPVSRRPSINLFVRPNRLQQDRLGSFMLHILENDPEIVPRATGPRTLQFTFQLVRSQLRMERIFSQ